MPQSFEIRNWEDLEDFELSIKPPTSWPAIQPARRSKFSRIQAAAAGDYSAADVVSNSVTDTLGLPNRIPGVTDLAGQVAILDAVSGTCSEDSILARFRLHWYNYPPLPADVEMDDNIAADWAKISAGREGYLGYTDIPAFADRGTAMSHSQATGLRQELLTKVLPSTPPGGSGDLWYVLEILDAEANETANMLIDFTLSFLN